MSNPHPSLVPERPPSGPPRPWRFPAFERMVVAGGTVLAVDLPGQQLASVLLVVDAGAVAEPAGKEGVALLTARALGEGTEVRDADGFAVAGEQLGASWYSDIGWDSLRAGFDVPVGNVPDAVSLLAEAVRRPAFADDDVERVRSDRLDELRIEEAQPGSRAQVAFIDAVFAATSRYARRDGGTVASVSELGPADLRAFRRERFAPTSATLIVAGELGDLDPTELGETLFKGWAASTPPAAEPHVSERGGGRRVLLVDRPGSVQSAIVQGHSGPSRSLPDYVATTTMAMGLGGIFSSRLNLVLREQRGYTYGVRSAFDLRRHGGTFATRMAVQTEVTAAAAVECEAQIRRTHDEGLSVDELAAVRNYRAGVFPIAFSSPHAVAGALGDLVVHGLPDDYYDTVREQISSVTVEDIAIAARERLHPDEMLTVVVGDASKVTDELRDAGLGPVEVVTD